MWENFLEEQLDIRWLWPGELGEVVPRRGSLVVTAINEKALGPMHKDVATSLHNLANLYREQGKYGEAATHFAQAARLQPDNAQARTHLAEMLVKRIRNLHNDAKAGLAQFHLEQRGNTEKRWNASSSAARSRGYSNKPARTSRSECRR